MYFRTAFAYEIVGSMPSPDIDEPVSLSQWQDDWPLRFSAECRRLVGALDVPGRYYFRLRSDHEFNVHVVQRGGAHWINNLALRDYLRRSPSACERYATAKLGAYESGARSLLAYSVAKADVVSQLLREALAKRD